MADGEPAAVDVDLVVDAQARLGAEASGPGDLLRLDLEHALNPNVEV